MSIDDCFAFYFETIGGSKLPKRNKGRPCQHFMDKGLIEPLAQFFFYTNNYINSCISQSLHTSGSHNWVWINHPNNNLLHFGFYQGFTAWWSSPIVITWFQAHISCCILSQILGISKGKDLKSNHSQTVCQTNMAS